MKILLFLIAATIATYSNAALDFIEIKQVFVTDDGMVAIQSTAIPKQADAEGNCHSGQEEWARYWFGFKVTEQSQAMVAAVLSAKAQGLPLNLSSSGCEGAWHKVKSLYF